MAQKAGRVKWTCSAFLHIGRRGIKQNLRRNCIFERRKPSFRKFYIFLILRSGRGGRAAAVPQKGKGRMQNSPSDKAKTHSAFFIKLMDKEWASRLFADQVKAKIGVPPFIVCKLYMVVRMVFQTGPQKFEKGEKLFFGQFEGNGDPSFIVFVLFKRSSGK